jgi:hypothetical protein
VLPLCYPPFPALLPLVARFHAHAGAVIRAEWVPALSAFLTASADGDCALWSSEGVRIGTLGDHAPRPDADANKTEMGPAEPAPAADAAEPEAEAAAPAPEATPAATLVAFASQMQAALGLNTGDVAASRGGYDAGDDSTWEGGRCPVVEVAADLEWQDSQRVAALAACPEDAPGEAEDAPADEDAPSPASAPATQLSTAPPSRVPTGAGAPQSLAQVAAQVVAIGQARASEPSPPAPTGPTTVQDRIDAYLARKGRQAAPIPTHAPARSQRKKPTMAALHLYEMEAVPQFDEFVHNIQAVRRKLE